MNPTWLKQLLLCLTLSATEAPALAAQRGVGLAVTAGPTWVGTSGDGGVADGSSRILWQRGGALELAVHGPLAGPAVGWTASFEVYVGSEVSRPTGCGFCPEQGPPFTVLPSRFFQVSAGLSLSPGALGRRVQVVVGPTVGWSSALDYPDQRSVSMGVDGAFSAFPLPGVARRVGVGVGVTWLASTIGRARWLLTPRVQLRL